MTSAIEYRPHSAAELFPMMPEADLAQLAEDIRANGLLEPILLLDERILDGRNRAAACKIAGVDPRYTRIKLDTSPTLFVVSKNLHRRHLTTSQRAAIAAEMMPLLREEAKERQREGGHVGGEMAGQGRPKADRVLTESTEPYLDKRPNELRGNARDIAGKATGVGGCTVQRALVVQREAPEEFEKVKRGEMTVESAIRKIEEKAEPSKRQQMIEQAAVRRMVTALSQGDGLRECLLELNLPAISEGCSKKELRTWAAMCREISKAFREFGNQLEKLSGQGGSK